MWVSTHVFSQILGRGLKHPLGELISAVWCPFSGSDPVPTLLPRPEALSQGSNTFSRLYGGFLEA